MEKRLFYNQDEYIKCKGQVWRVKLANKNRGLVFAKNIVTGAERYLYTSDIEDIAV